MDYKKTLALSVFLLILNGCGGSESSPVVTPPPMVTPPPVTVVNADVSLTYKEGELKFQWISTFDDELGYAIQTKNTTKSKSQTISSEWVTIQSTEAITQGFYGEQSITNSSGNYRIVAIMSDSSEVILGSINGTVEFFYDELTSNELVITPPVVSPPYQGIMTFGLSESALSSKWFVDSIDSCKSNICASNTIELDTSSYTDGSHRLDAVVEMAADVFVYVNQTIVIYNPKLTLSLNLQDSNIDTTLILPNATSKAQITEVSYFVDEVLVTTQTDKTPITLNQCDRWGCSDVSYDYHLKWNKEYGEHTIKVIVSDSDGQYQEKAQLITVNNAPSINIDAPLSQQLVTNDILQVTGTVDNENENVTTTVSFGDIQIGQKLGNGNFSYNYSLVGLPEGNYMVSVTSIDEFNMRSTAQVPFKYAPSLSRAELISTLPENATIKQIVNDYVLIAKPNNVYTVLNINDGTEWSIDTSDLTQLSWHKAIVDYQGNIVFGSSLKYKYITSISITDIPKNSIYVTGHLSSEIDTVITHYGLSGSMLYWNSASDSNAVIKNPDGGWLNHKWHHNENILCHSVNVSRNRYDVYLHRFMSEDFQRVTVTDGETNSFCIGVDDYQFAYTTGNDSNSKLYIGDVLPPHLPVLLSDNLVGSGIRAKAKFDNGLTVWQEVLNNKNMVKIFDTATQLTVEIKDATFIEVGFGKVSYTNDDGLFVWDKATKSSHQIWFSNISHYLSQSTNYIQSGQLIYRVDN
jgi:hypothetical protein